MPDTIPLLITSSFNNSGLQWLNGSPKSSGFWQDIAIMQATCSSENFGGLPLRRSSDNIFSIVLRILRGFSSSVFRSSFSLDA
jgi:hypothetical protein